MKVNWYTISFHTSHIQHNYPSPATISIKILFATPLFSFRFFHFYSNKQLTSTWKQMGYLGNILLRFKFNIPYSWEHLIQWSGDMLSYAVLNKKSFEGLHYAINSSIINDNYSREGQKTQKSSKPKHNNRLYRHYLPRFTLCQTTLQL